MELLITGVVVWSLVHLFKSLAPQYRKDWIEHYGAGPWRGFVSLTLIGSIVLMVIGWRSTTPEFVYDPPSWGRHLNMLLMIIAIYLFGVAQGKSRIKQWIRHPMLTGMLVFAAGHLLANGDNRSLLLFGGLGLWALISIFTISRNEGTWVKPTEFPSIGRELVSVIIALVLYTVLFTTHQWFTGMPLVAR